MPLLRVQPLRQICLYEVRKMTNLLKTPKEQQHPSFYIKQRWLKKKIANYYKMKKMHDNIDNIKKE